MENVQISMVGVKREKVETTRAETALLYIPPVFEIAWIEVHWFD